MSTTALRDGSKHGAIPKSTTFRGSLDDAKRFAEKKLEAQRARYAKKFGDLPANRPENVTPAPAPLAPERIDSACPGAPECTPFARCKACRTPSSFVARSDRAKLTKAPALAPAKRTITIALEGAVVERLAKTLENARECASCCADDSAALADALEALARAVRG